MLGKESCSVMTIEWMEGLALFSALLDDNQVFWGETFAAMLISHSTAYQCFQCGDRRCGFFDPIFVTSLKVVALSICCPSIFSARFWTQFESNHGCILRCASSRWLRNHELVGSATTTSQSFKPTSWLGGFRGGVNLHLFSQRNPELFKVCRTSTLWRPGICSKSPFSLSLWSLRWSSQFQDTIDLWWLVSYLEETNQHGFLFGA